MASIIGTHLRLSIFGQSHAQGIGCVIDGLPSGLPLDLPALEAFLAKRAPGHSPLSTARAEKDRPEWISGLYEGRTCGAPLCAVIANTDARSADYRAQADLPRPGHADFPAQCKYGGAQDIRGGGHFSGRLTAPLCIAGGICLQLLSRYGISVGAHILSVKHLRDTPFDPVGISEKTLARLAEQTFPVLCGQAGEAMQALIARTRENGDSVGGIIECAVTGLPAGIGDPMFDGMENRLSSVLFGIPAVKGIEFGDGFQSTLLYGSENNDPYLPSGDDAIRTATNHAGGILGGLTTGMPLIFRCAVKPTPSVAKEQRTVSLAEKESRTLSVRGRHDPCIVPRAVPCVIAAAAFAVCDALLADGFLPQALPVSASKEEL